MTLRKLGSLILISFYTCTEAIPIQVQDDTGVSVTLDRPARRIVSLAPHATELIFALGKGDKIVAVDRASDYPKAAQSIEKIADFQSVQLDRLLFLKPDLVIVWHNRAVEKHRIFLKNNGIQLFISRPLSFTDIASNLQRLGILFGVEEKGQQQAKKIRDEVEQLSQTYRTIPPVKTYLQLADYPLLSVSDRSFIGKMFALCGGDNIFSSAQSMTPIVNPETVLVTNPEVMFYLGSKTAFLQRWGKYPQLKAVKNGHLIGLESELISRPGPRLIEGQKLICYALHRITTIK